MASIGRDKKDRFSLKSASHMAASRPGTLAATAPQSFVAAAAPPLALKLSKNTMHSSSLQRGPRAGPEVETSSADGLFFCEGGWETGWEKLDGEAGFVFFDRAKCLLSCTGGPSVARVKPLGRGVRGAVRCDGYAKGKVASMPSFPREIYRERASRAVKAPRRR